METILEPTISVKPEQVNGKAYYYLHSGNAVSDLFAVKIVDDLMVAHRLIMLNGDIHNFFVQGYKDKSDAQKAFKNHKFNINGNYALLVPVSEEEYRNTLKEFDLFMKNMEKAGA